MTGLGSCRPTSCVNISYDPSIEDRSYIEGQATCTSAKVGEFCDKKCARGFIGGGPAECKQDGNFSQPPTCEKVKCAPPPTGADFSFSCSSSLYEYGTTCRTLCREGHKPKTAAMTSIQCGINDDGAADIGAWDKTDIVCVKKECADPPALPNGDYECEGGGNEPGTAREGSLCKVNCHTGYYYQQAANGVDAKNQGITCNDQVWDDPGQCTELQCYVDDMQPVAYGLSKHDTELAPCRVMPGGSTCTQFRCVSGYDLMGKLECVLGEITRPLCIPTGETVNGFLELEMELDWSQTIVTDYSKTTTALAHMVRPNIF